jgi:hypothetical protein
LVPRVLARIDNAGEAGSKQGVRPQAARPAEVHSAPGQLVPVRAQVKKPSPQTGSSGAAGVISGPGGRSMIKAETGGAVRYRAIHTRTLWRKVHSHKSLDAAINGKDGAAGLFARKVRIDYGRHGDPLFVLVWQAGAKDGYAIRQDRTAPQGIEVVTVPVATLERFDGDGQASQREIGAFFPTKK